jgi:alkylation response protein AidB-like acyl-CoA dehydrogenase
MTAAAVEAARLAADVLAPAAVEVDRAGAIPPSHLDSLAAAGLYGVFAPSDYGGLIETDPAAAYEIVEILASGCLSTAFVWMQHHGAVRSVAACPDEAVRARWLGPMSRGEVRAGLAVGGLRPGPPSVRLRARNGGYVIDGQAPWVTGWGMVDVLLVAGRDADDTAVWLLVDAADLAATPLHLVAVMASRTATLQFSETFVPAERRTAAMPFARWPERDAAGLRMNGSLALGLIRRCCAALPDLDGADFDASLARCRDDLDRAGPAELPAARAAAAELAYRVAGALMVHAGAAGVLAGDPAALAVREAAFLLVFGTRPAIRTALVERLAAGARS